MGNIVLLDDLTINKIAAGEVIERPASVIKEMVENSIDAGANNITVEIKNGGISFIKVTDNGKGIASDDLEIAFERHATSKIRSADDLNLVTSMGFRGEALASIAAIANVEMISKTQIQDTGYKVVVEAGNVLEKQEVGCQTGTSITVRNLFFNTPVRYKFLKKDYTESGYVEDVITRIALVNPDIAIKLINTGKTVIQTNGNGDIKSVIYSIYGKDVATGILPVNYMYEDIQISGVIGKPEIARSNRANQLFFVNKRYIKDKTLSAATEQAFKGLIPIGKFGFVILNIDMSPSKVDVNVHPAKLEVRFEEENKIFQSIYHSIKDTLLKSELVANTESQENIENNISKGLFDFRKNEINKIEQYNEEESKIKTNVVNVGQGGPVNTADILEQLKKMRNDLEKQVEENSSIKLSSNFIENKNDNIQNSEEVKNPEEDIIIEKDEENVLEDGYKSEQSNIEIVIDDSDNLEEMGKCEKQKNIKDLESQKNIQQKENLESLDNEENLEELRSSEKLDKMEDKQDLQNLDEIEEMQDLENIEKIEEIQNSENIENDKYLENIGNLENAEDAEIKLQEVEKQIQELENLKYDEKPSENFNEMYAKLFGTKPISTENTENTENVEDTPQNMPVDLLKENMTIFEESEEYEIPIYKFIGIAFNTYIIIEMDEEIYILDQHAAHERIMYEKVKNNYYSETSKDSQMLLLPDIITLSHKEMEIARENMDMFKKAGFCLEEFGENTIKLTGVPTVCIDIDNKDLFLETLDEINTVARTAKQEKEERFIATVACKAAVKANMVLTVQEVESLMNKLLQLPNPFTCPHGRPIAVKMTKYDIERKFARK